MKKLCSCFSMSSSSTGESKTSSNNTNAAVVFTDLLGIVNHGYSLTWCKSIFAYLGPTAKDTMKLRSYCKLFSKALKPLPCWTSYPHPEYPTLNKLFDCFKEVSSSGSTNIPKVLLIDNGVHVIEDGEYYVNINIPISIIGESREHCSVIGGLEMKGKKEDNVNVSSLTLRDSKSYGVCGDGASFHLDNVSVENSGWIGVLVYGTKRSTMKNCNVSHSRGSGLVVDYGLHTDSSSDSIHLVSPLIGGYGETSLNFTNNDGGRNYGGSGTIKSVNKDGKVLEVVYDGTPDEDDDEDQDDY